MTPRCDGVCLEDSFDTHLIFTGLREVAFPEIGYRSCIDAVSPLRSIRTFHCPQKSRENFYHQGLGVFSVRYENLMIYRYAYMDI